MIWGEKHSEPLKKGSADHELALRNEQDAGQSAPNWASVWEHSQMKRPGPRPGLQMLPQKTALQGGTKTPRDSIPSLPPRRPELI